MTIEVNVEELARAMWEYSPYGDERISWAGLTKRAKSDAEFAAVRKDQINTVRALLTALRTPSEPMVDAMLTTDVPNATQWEGEDVEIMRGDLARAFTAAIDSLLEQGDGE